MEGVVSGVFIVMVGDSVAGRDVVALMTLSFGVESQDAGVATQTAKAQVGEVFNDAVVTSGGVIVLEDGVGLSHCTVVVLENGKNFWVDGHASGASSPLVGMNGVMFFGMTC